MLTPEQQARQKIDALLEAGWVIQSMNNFNRNASLGVAVREFQLASGPCDYLLFIEGKAAGVIEAKRQGVTLSGVAEQSEKYMNAISSHLAKWDDNLIFIMKAPVTKPFSEIYGILSPFSAGICLPSASNIIAMVNTT